MGGGAGLSFEKKIKRKMLVVFFLVALMTLVVLLLVITYKGMIEN